MTTPVLAPRVKFGGLTPFGMRMTTLSAVRDPVADYVVERFVQEGHSAFISDGVTAFAIALHLFNRKRRVLIHTNSLAIAVESCMWQSSGGSDHFHLIMPAGVVDERLCMLYGRKANRFARDSASELEWTVLSVSAFFGDRGPAGQEYNSLQIKRAAVERPRRVIWLADANKLSQEYQSQPLVYASESDWRTAAQRGNVWVVTSKPAAAVPEIKDIDALPPNAVAALRQQTNGVYAINRARLVKLLGDRFVEV